MDLHEREKAMVTKTIEAIQKKPTMKCIATIRLPSAQRTKLTAAGRVRITSEKVEMKAAVLGMKPGRKML